MEKSDKILNLIDYIRTKIVPGNSKKITASTKLFKEHIIESMNILYLIGYVEGYIGRKMTDDEMIMSNFESVDAIVGKFMSSK